MRIGIICTVMCVLHRLEVVDDSAKHAGHAGSRMSAGVGGETHFVVTVVSASFEGMNAVARHKKIYQVRGAAGVETGAIAVH